MSFGEDKALLAAHIETLLGPARTHRGVRIMVTLGVEAADDYHLVHDLLAHGMDCLRINCAHDSPEVRSRTIEHLDRARRELGSRFSILMDVGAPKLRTGPIEPGPSARVASKARWSWQGGRTVAHLARTRWGRSSPRCRWGTSAKQGTHFACRAGLKCTI